MTDTLLSSENFIKSVSNISDNLSGKYILPALREAQEIDLRCILGDHLLDRLKELVSNSTIKEEQYKAYKALLDKAQYFLAYTVVSRVCVMASFKIDNAGVSRVSDENMEPVPIDEVYNLKEFYQKKADHYCFTLQNFILDNRSDYPELTENDCHSIRANLYSAASGGLWLGGARGNKNRRRKR